MGTKALELELALLAHRKSQRQTEELVARMLRSYGRPKRKPAESRAKLARKLKGISVSSMIAEDRA